MRNTGLPVVLLHGLAGYGGEWATIGEGLGSAYRLTTPDQRGHGASERRPRDVSRAALVADVISLLDQLGTEQAVLVGQSLGGRTAMLTAAAHPDRVCALVLVEAGAGPGDPGSPAKIGEWLGSWPTPFRSRADAVGFFGGGPRGEAWAGGLGERDDG
jgi:pimeloyl-ACP methyl ester carboxylesterase